MTKSISLTSVMKKTLKEATEKFEANLCCDEHITAQQTLNPVTVTNHGHFINDRNTVVRSEMYMTYPFMLWDPLSQYKTLFINKLICPLCSDNKDLSNALFRSGEWYNGRLARLNPRVIFDIHTCILLVSAVYKCSKGHEITACHPDVLHVLKGRTEVPFFLTHRHRFTLELANIVEELIDNGLSFEQVEDTIRKQYKSIHNRFEASFWRDLALSKTFGVFYEESDMFFPAFSSQSFPHPSATILIDVFLKRFLQNEYVYRDSMNLLNAKWITCDHTFKSVCNIGYTRSEDGKWINQYTSVFCVLNENGEVIHWQFTSSEGFEELRGLFTDIKHKSENDPLSIICIDNCCKWDNLLKEIFPQTLIKQDLFHAVQRFCKTLRKKNPFYRELSQDYGKIFRHFKDTGDERKMETPNIKTLLENLCKFLKKWEDREHGGIKILTKDQIDAIAKIRNHIVKGCLSGIPAHCSTSLNERLHKDMNKLLSKNRIGVQLAFAKFSRYFFRHNQKRSEKHTIESLQAKKLNDFCKGKVNSNQVDITCFGIKPKCKSSDSLFHTQTVSPPTSLNKLTMNELNDASKSIAEVLEKEKYINVNVDTAGTDSFKSQEDINTCVTILQHGLTIFKVMSTVKELWSSKSINLLKIPFIFEYTRNILSPDSPNKRSAASRSIDEHDRLHNIASSFGFDIVQTMGDGDCFFTSVSFQLLQILSSDQCPTQHRSFLHSLGITSDLAVNDLSRRLRELVVNEWILNQNEYRSFFGNIDLQSETERFRRSGEFAGSLGDALPMGMANILNMPLIILTTVHNMPIISVVPRISLNNPTAIYLSYMQQGPGHYDAVVAQGDNLGEQAIKKNNEIKTSEKTG